MRKQKKQADAESPHTDSPAPRSKVSGIQALLNKFEGGIANAELKISVTEYIRLVQLESEMEPDEPRKVEVTWIDITAAPPSGAD